MRELVDSPRDVPTYDYKPEMSARESSEAFIRHWEEDDPGVRDHQLRQRRHGRPHRRDRGGGEGRRDRRRVPRPRGRGGARHAAAPASSSPTTATPTRCSRRTARPTPRTRSTRCRSSSPSDGARMDGEGILADVAPTVLALLGIEQPRGDDRPLAAGRRLRGADMAERTSHPPGRSRGPTSRRPTRTGARRSTARCSGGSTRTCRWGEGAYSMAQARRPRRRRAVAAQRADDADAGIPPHWNVYVTVEDVDAAAAQVAAAGGQVFAEPFDVFDAGRMAVSPIRAAPRSASGSPARTSARRSSTSPGALTLGGLRHDRRARRRRRSTRRCWAGASSR